MSVVIGLDIGGSTTKVVGFANGQRLKYVMVKASDPIASAYGGLGRFLKDNNLKISQIKKIMLTGVGASYIKGNIFECETKITPEFDAVGLGGLYTSGLKEAIVISMGTGTSFVAARENSIKHIIGSGVGGGTLLGLANKMINVRDFNTISLLADKGDLLHIDLTIGDISEHEIPGLSSDTTASNFGKCSETASSSDLALGIVNLVFQSIGTAGVLVARLENLKDIVVVGTLSSVPEGRKTLAKFASLYEMKINVPEDAEFATAFGAALYGMADRS